MPDSIRPVSFIADTLMVNANALHLPMQIVFETYDPGDERRRGALFALGNGLLSMRASAPEAAAGLSGYSDHHYAGLYRAGWYDEAPRNVNGQSNALAALVNLPDPFGLSVSVDDGASWFTLDSVELLDYRQVLTLDSGILTRKMVFRLADGREMYLLETRLISMDKPHLGALRWQLHSSGWSGRLRVRASLDAGVVNAAVGRNAAYEGRRLRDVRHYQQPDGFAAIGVRLHDRTRRAVVATRTRLSGHDVEWHADWNGMRLVQETDCDIVADGAVTIEKTVAVLADAEIGVDGTDPQGLQHAIEMLHEAPDLNALEMAHTQAWQRLWRRMPIHAESQALERSLRFHCFHVVQAISPHSVGRDLGFPARGWQEGYFGQVFWDEIFAFPFLCTHFPAAARTLLLYRHARLETARQRASRAGYRGAMFPWRSGRSGEEETPPFQFNPLSKRWMSDHSYRQRHIGAAIAYNVWQYCLTTGDEGLLAGEGGELIVEIARFWASIAHYDDRRERYVIRGVLGPDEYHNAYPQAEEPGVANNAYTNVMAVWTLCRAFDVLDSLPVQRSEALRERLAITDAELRHWDHVSRRMYVPIINDGIVSQFEGFDTLKPVPQAWLEDDHPRIDWWLEARGESADDYQLTKQADVLMLMHLFPPPTLHGLFARLGYTIGIDECRCTANYYMARITHESSLSKVVCAGALAQIDSHASWQFFSNSLRSDLDAPSDDGVQEGVHLGAMAGTLDVLQRHYLGVRPEADGLYIYPAPPPLLDNMALDILYRGERLTIALEGDTLTIRAQAANNHGISVIHRDGSSLLRPGEWMSIYCRE